MQRTRKPKLSIKRETLRKLDEAELGQVAGGTGSLNLQYLKIVSLSDCTGLGRLGGTLSCVVCA